MTEFASTQPTEYDATITSKSCVHPLQEIANDIKQGWRSNQSQELATLLLENPELCNDRSIVIDLAVEEYRIRQSKNCTSEIREYCQPFLRFGSSLHSSIVRQIEVELYLDGHPSLRLLDQQTDWPEIGERIGNFQVLDELGRGALARVYLCLQIGLGDRQVVVKVSRRGTQEADTLGKLQHPHIMPVYSIEAPQESGLCYLCTPFLGRSTLQDLITHAYAKDDVGADFKTGFPRRGRVLREAATFKIKPSDRFAEGPPPDSRGKNRSYVEGILFLVVRLTDALSHAHAHGVIHGDLKPSNVLLTPSGEPVLLDFNLSQDDALGVGLRGGTLPYMAPEQISAPKLDGHASHHEIDERSEIFSLGVIVYELLSGQLPFEVGGQKSDADYPRLLLDRQRKGPKTLLAHSPLVGSSLAALTDRCLAYDPVDRFASMADLRAALVSELTLRRRALRWTRAHRRASTILLCSTMAITVAAATWLVNRPPYPVRQYENGLDYYADGSFDKALTAFDQATSAQPDYLEARYAAARTNLALDKVDQAIKQFADLAKNDQHAPSMAYVGYCFNLRKGHSLAIPWYQKALAAGLESAGTHNNLAVSYMLGESAHSKLETLKLSQEHLEKALEILPSPALHLNLAYNDLDHFFVDSSYLPHRGIDQIRMLVKHGAHHSNIPVLLARLYGAYAKSDPRIIGEAIELLIEGCENNAGIDMAMFTNDPLLDAFSKHPQFAALQEAAAKQKKNQRATRLARLIDPISQSAE